MRSRFKWNGQNLDGSDQIENPNTVIRLKKTFHRKRYNDDKKLTNFFYVKRRRRFFFGLLFLSHFLIRKEFVLWVIKLFCSTQSSLKVVNDSVSPPPRASWRHRRWASLRDLKTLFPDRLSIDLNFGRSDFSVGLKCRQAKYLWHLYPEISRTRLKRRVQRWRSDGRILQMQFNNDLIRRL